MGKLFDEVERVAADRQGMLLVTDSHLVKGKVVRLPRPQFCLVIRTQGGENFVGRLIPSRNEEIFPADGCRRLTVAERSSLDQPSHLIT